MTKSTKEGNFKVIVHVLNSFDESFVCQERDELIEKLKIAYHLATKQKKKLDIYGLDG